MSSIKPIGRATRTTRLPQYVESSLVHTCRLLVDGPNGQSPPFRGVAAGLDSMHLRFVGLWKNRHTCGLTSDLLSQGELCHRKKFPYRCQGFLLPNCKEIVMHKTRDYIGFSGEKTCGIVGGIEER